MNIMELGAIGELVGGVAVLVTLIYLAAQVRQSARAQRQANELAKAEALRQSVAMYTAPRQMLIEEGMSAIWLKALNDEELAPIEEQRLFVLLQQLTYSAVAALAIQESAGNLAQAENAPSLVARYVSRSATVRRVWSPLADELADNGYADFAAVVVRQLGAEGARP